MFCGQVCRGREEGEEGRGGSRVGVVAAHHRRPYCKSPALERLQAAGRGTLGDVFLDLASRSTTDGRLALCSPVGLSSPERPAADRGPGGCQGPRSSTGKTPTQPRAEHAPTCIEGEAQRVRGGRMARGRKGGGIAYVLVPNGVGRVQWSHDAPISPTGCRCLPLTETRRSRMSARHTVGGHRSEDS